MSTSYTRVAGLLSLVGAAVLLNVSAAQAAFTSANCLAKKRQAQGKLQKCRATEEAKALQGKPADLAKCETKFQEKIAKMNEKATEAGIACRFVDNGNSITDYDTGLQWVETNNLDNVQNFANPQDADNTYTWGNLGGCPFTGCANGTVYTDYLSRLNACHSIDGITPVFAGFAAHCDWRLPTPTELKTILLEPYPCGTSPCIDPIFGPTNEANYWSSTTRATADEAWFVSFIDGSAIGDLKVNGNPVRGVRGGL